MALRSGFVPPFPGTHALFLTNEELAALKFMTETACFTKPSNVELLLAMRRGLGTKRLEPHG